MLWSRAVGPASEPRLRAQCRRNGRPWLSGGGAPSREAVPAPSPPAGRPGQAVLFALRDPPPAPPPPPPALGPPGLGEGALGLGTGRRLGPRVVLAAVGAPVRGGAQGGPVLVLLAERVGAQVAKGGGGLAAHVTVMPGAHPLPCKRRPLASRQDCRPTCLCLWPPPLPRPALRPAGPLGTPPAHTSWGLAILGGAHPLPPRLPANLLCRFPPNRVSLCCSQHWAGWLGAAGVPAPTTAGP